VLFVLKIYDFHNPTHEGEEGEGWLIKDVNVTRVAGYFPRGGGLL